MSGSIKSDQRTTSIISSPSSARMALIRLPRIPTTAPTASTCSSRLQTTTSERPPASLVMPRISTKPKAISGTFFSSARHSGPTSSEPWSTAGRVIRATGSGTPPRPLAPTFIGAEAIVLPESWDSESLIGICVRTTSRRRSPVLIGWVRWKRTAALGSRGCAGVLERQFRQVTLQIQLPRIRPRAGVAGEFPILRCQLRNRTQVQPPHYDPVRKYPLACIFHGVAGDETAMAMPNYGHAGYLNVPALKTLSSLGRKPSNQAAVVWPNRRSGDD
jgi:hypothetical protein